MPLTLGVEGDGSGGGGDDKSKTGDEDKVSKAEYDKLVADNAKLKQDFEDTRMEVFSDNYMAFLENKDRKVDVTPDKKLPDGKDEDLSKLSPKELIARAKEEFKREQEEARLKDREETISSVKKEQTQKEVASFARSHGDYEKWRPVMYGLSLDPKNKDLSLQELYEKAKDHVTRLGQPSEEEKERQRKLSTEKPGGSSESYEKYQKMSADAIAKETLSEVKEKLGPIPPA